MTRSRAAGGSYILVLLLEREVRRLTVGRLGTFDFAAGYYLYVGSAMGSGGLAARLAHHQRSEMPCLHWHFDYLRPYGRLREAWAVASPRRLECVWCHRLAGAGELSIPVPRFGASDTRCPSHLFYSPTPPSPRLLGAITLGDLIAGTRPADSLDLRLDVHLFDE